MTAGMMTVLMLSFCILFTGDSRITVQERYCIYRKTSEDGLGKKRIVKFSIYPKEKKIICA